MIGVLRSRAWCRDPVAAWCRDPVAAFHPTRADRAVPTKTVAILGKPC